MAVPLILRRDLVPAFTILKLETFSTATHDIAKMDGLDLDLSFLQAVQIASLVLETCHRVQNVSKPSVAIRSLCTEIEELETSVLAPRIFLSSRALDVTEPSVAIRFLCEETETSILATTDVLSNFQKDLKYGGLSLDEALKNREFESTLNHLRITTTSVDRAIASMRDITFKSATNTNPVSWSIARKNFDLLIMGG